jgi:hypothetical protein
LTEEIKTMEEVYLVNPLKAKKSLKSISAKLEAESYDDYMKWIEKRKEYTKPKLVI